MANRTMLVEVKRRPDIWDNLRDHLRVALGQEALDDWEWNKKPEEKRPIIPARKNPHFFDAYYKPRTTKKKRTSPDINEIPNLPIYVPPIVLATSSKPCERSSKPFEQTKQPMKKDVKKKVEEPQEGGNNTTIGEMV